MARALILWTVVLAIVSVFLFLGFHIVKTSLTPEKRVEQFQPPPIEYQPPPPIRTQAVLPPLRRPELETQAPAQDDTSAHEMPHVTGQTEEDLRASEPHIASPPSTFYDAPEATDPLDKVGYMDAEFGSNLRHPEQMIERRPQRNMDRVIASGLGSAASGPGGNNAAGYTPEMTNNGGEFIQGIIPFDSSEMGGGFSMI